MNLVIIDYGAGNISSVKNVLNHLGYNSKLSSDKEEILQADKVIFPGVGHARHAMQQINQKNIGEIIKNLKQPLLGVCLGMQLLCSHSEEDNTDTLSVFNQDVKKFRGEMKIPHMGWNSVFFNEDSIYKEFNGAFFYFVHTYYTPIFDFTLGKTEYTIPFSAAIQKNNFTGCQFHPEKSGEVGLAFLEKFLKI